MNKSTRIIIVFVVLAAAVGVLLVKQIGRTSSSASDSTPTAGSAETTGTTESTVPLPRLVDLGGTGCPTCVALAPVIDGIERDFAGQLEVQKVNIIEDPEAGRLFDVRVIPTLVFMDAQGKELARHEGYLTRKWIMDTWGELGYGFKPLTEGD